MFMKQIVFIIMGMFVAPLYANDYLLEIEGIINNNDQNKKNKINKIINISPEFEITHDLTNELKIAFSCNYDSDMPRFLHIKATLSKFGWQKKKKLFAFAELDSRQMICAFNQSSIFKIPYGVTDDGKIKYWNLIITPKQKDSNEESIINSFVELDVSTSPGSDCVTH